MIISATIAAVPLWSRVGVPRRISGEDGVYIRTYRHIADLATHGGAQDFGLVEGLSQDVGVKGVRIGRRLLRLTEQALLMAVAWWRTGCCVVAQRTLRCAAR